MHTCKHCGQALSSNANFCPSCGAKIAKHSEKEYRKAYPQSMYKNTVQSLAKEGKSFVGKQVQQKLDSLIPKGKKITESTQQLSDLKKPSIPCKASPPTSAASRGGIDFWTWIYLAINVALMYLGYRSDEVIGVILFTIVIILIVFLRRNKPNPYNWLVKIMLVLQSVLLIAFIMDQGVYMGIITFLMILLVLVNLRLFFKGNKS